MPQIMQEKQTALRLLESLISQNPQKAAQELISLPLSEACALLAGIKNEAVIPCLENMPPKNAAFLLRRMPSKQAALILCRMQSEKAAEIAVNLPAPYKNKLNAENGPALKTLEDILSFPKQSAGRMMQQNFLSFKTDVKVSEIAERLKNMPKNKLPLYVFILDKGGSLAGTIKTAELAFLSANSPCGSVMDREQNALNPLDGLQKICAVYRKSGALTIPVIDKEGALLGILPPEKIMAACAAAPQKETATDFDLYQKQKNNFSEDKSRAPEAKTPLCCAKTLDKTKVLLAVLAAACLLYALLARFNL